MKLAVEGISRTPQGVRGLKLAHIHDRFAPASRTPQGVRGLKFELGSHREERLRRTPQGVRGLKFVDLGKVRILRRGRTPQGVRGLKSVGPPHRNQHRCRTPQGVRGLKYHRHAGKRRGEGSHPARGAWIEMSHFYCEREVYAVAPRKGCVD